MSPPPSWLIEWTQFIGLLVSTIAAIRALWHGGSALAFKAKVLQRAAA